MDGRETILSVGCKEPGGEVVRHVKLAHLDYDRLKFLWEKLSKFDVLFNDYVRGDFGAFMNHFVLQVEGQPVPAGIIWDVDDVGLFFLNELVPHVSGTAHFVFWDRRFRGREQLCRDMVDYAIERYDLKRMETRVPLYANFTMQAVERMGFTLEGRIRQAIKYKGDLFDVNIYSALPGELKEKSNGSTSST